MREPIHLPIDEMKAAVDRQLQAYKEATGQTLRLEEADMQAVKLSGDYYLRLAFPDGPIWLVPFDEAANATMQGLAATRH